MLSILRISVPKAKQEVIMASSSIRIADMNTQQKRIVGRKLKLEMSGNVDGR
jgi:hypothetical protein